ncbi:MAG TPA: TonB-dependent receptor [Bacteroidales bacterium]|nr:TonB-dependent receptor [Bacteroidales bacterium]
MKRSCIAILFLLSLQFVRGQNVDTCIDFHFRNVSFKEFSEYVYNSTGIRIYYVSSQLDSIRVNIDADSIPVISAVEMVLDGTGLFVSEWNHNLVIMGRKLLSALPLYEAGKSSDSILVNLPEENVESKYLAGRKAEAIQKITVGRKGAAISRAIVRITGRVTDSETGEPLISVPLYIVETKTGVLSDLNGSFTFALNPGKYTFQAGYLGYEQEKYLLEVLSEGSFTIALKKATIRLQDVFVTAESSSAMRIKQPGLEQISVRNIRSLPVMLGERDILKVTGTLPGIVSAGEGSAGLNVRGSGSDENAFYLNRIPVYNTAHLFGFFSAFNSDIIKDFSVYKGHVPVEFGGRLASVFNITARQGNRRNYTARGGISPVAANVVAEGPLKRDTSSFILSARSTYSDWMLSRIRDTTIRASRAHFDDISGGMNWDFKKTRVSAFYYHSYDYFKLDEITKFNYSNDGGSLIINRNLGNAVRGEFSTTGSAYGFFNC